MNMLVVQLVEQWPAPSPRKGLGFSLLVALLLLAVDPAETQGDL
jgi:hypothetical protein